MERLQWQLPTLRPSRRRLRRQPTTASWFETFCRWFGMIQGPWGKLGDRSCEFLDDLFVIDDAWGTVGSTLMNATSSRAHTVQIIEFKVRDPVARSGNLWSAREFPRCYLQPVQAVTNGSATVSMINLATWLQRSDMPKLGFGGMAISVEKYGKMKNDEKWWRHSGQTLCLTSSIDLLVPPQVDLAGSEKAWPVESQEVGSLKDL